MNRVQQDIYNLAIEKLAASNLRSDLVLGRILPKDVKSLFSTPRYSRTNPGQILADIKSMLRGKGNNVGTLTSELTRRGIPYKVRGNGLSPRDIELDLSKGHDILNTPYLPSNYSESFANNNVNRRFKKAVDAANMAGYYDIKPVEEYSNPYVDAFRPHAGKKKNKPIHIAIPAKEVKGKDELQFDQGNASPILHETDEFKSSIQKDKHYDKVLKNIQDSPLHTTGKYPGVMVPRGRDRYGDDVVPLNMFGDAEKYSRSPYNTTGQNRHVSATILMNELMNQHALQVGTKPEPGSIWDTFSHRKQGPDNPVNRMTGIDLTSREQPFVPRNIAKNKKEYLKRIRAVSKAENALQSEYLRKKKLLGELFPYSPLEKMIDNQVIETIRNEEDLFKAFPQNIKFNSISDFDQYLQKNPAAKKYIDRQHDFMTKWRSQLPDDIDEWLRMHPKDKVSTFDDRRRFTDAQAFLESANGIFDEDLSDLLSYYRRTNKFKNFYDRRYNLEKRYFHHMLGGSQQNMDFLVNYLRSRGIPV